MLNSSSIGAAGWALLRFVVQEPLESVNCSDLTIIRLQFMRGGGMLYE
jgi:hypothetical protein